VNESNQHLPLSTSIEKFLSDHIENEIEKKLLTVNDKLLAEVHDQYRHRIAKLENKVEQLQNANNRMEKAILKINKQYVSYLSETHNKIDRSSKILSPTIQNTRKFVPEILNNPPNINITKQIPTKNILFLKQKKTANLYKTVKDGINQPHRTKNVHAGYLSSTPPWHIIQRNTKYNSKVEKSHRKGARASGTLYIC